MEASNSVIEASRKLFVTKLVGQHNELGNCLYLLIEAMDELARRGVISYVNI